MKLKILSLIVILGVMSVTPMIYMGKFDPMSFIDSVKNTDISDFKKLDVSVPGSIKNAVTEEKVQVYKWRDENGVMQFSNTPPANGGSAERVDVDTNKNVIQAVKIPVEVKKKAKPMAAVKAPSPYSPGGMKKVMDDAKGIEEMLKKRHEGQQKMMNNL